jgi:hypothetical protein
MVVGQYYNRCSLVLFGVGKGTPVERGLFAAIWLTAAGVLILGIIQAALRAWSYFSLWSRRPRKHFGHACTIAKPRPVDGFVP